jgi:5-methylcytosine-specific restriction endonuclease McrA
VSLFDEYPDLGTCPHPKGEPARIIQVNGASLAFMRCVDCDRPVQSGHWLAHDAIYGDIEDLPIWQDYREHNPRCARCGVLGTEEHHIHPKALAGAEEAELWPKIHLCRRCHGLWHTRLVRAVLEGRLRAGEDS